MATTAELNDRAPFDRSVIGVLAACLVLLHVAVNLLTVYEFHRDEFLYLAMGEHLRFFRMDFPPAIAVIANVSRAIFGDSLTGIRIFPAIAHGALALLGALAARELGGRAAAQRIAFLAVAVSPLFLRAGSMLQPVVFDQLWWTLALFALLRLASSNDGRWWLAVGAALGAGLLTKFSIAFIGVPMVFAVLLTTQRKWLRTRWPWLALCIALVIGAPSLSGQWLLDFPVRGQMESLQESQLSRVTYVDFLGEQLLLGPATILAMIGCGAMLTLERWKAYRVVALSASGAFLLLLLSHGKSYYIGPIYPLLYGAGAAWLSQLPRPRVRSAAVSGATLLLLAFGVVVFPMGVPVLPPERMARYAGALGIAEATETNQGVQLELPQDYADMIGWRDMVASVQRAYLTIPEHERADVVLIGENYGEAGALSFYGPRLGLPSVVSAAGSYWFFGPGDRPGRVVVTLGVDIDDLQQFFGDVTEVSRFDARWLVPEERGIVIAVARSPRTTLQALWPSLVGRN